MTAVDVDALDNLREALARKLTTWVIGVAHENAWNCADVLVELPEVVDLLAEVRRGRALREAVEHRAENAEERGEGICRTCLAPIWNEGGTVHRRKRDEGWSDRIERGGDSLVCFKAVDYRHVPLAGREAAIYDHAYARAAALRASNGDRQ